MEIRERKPGADKCIGIDIGGTNIKGVLLEGRKILKRVRCSTPSRIPGMTVKAVCELVERLSEKQKPNLPIGIACAGEIDENGVITADNLGWDKVDFASGLRKAGLRISPCIRTPMQPPRPNIAPEHCKTRRMRCISVSARASAAMSLWTVGHCGDFRKTPANWGI